MTEQTITDRDAFAAGWNASKRTRTYDLDAAESRFDRRHPDREYDTTFAAGWTAYATGWHASLSDAFAEFERDRRHRYDRRKRAAQA